MFLLAVTSLAVALVSAFVGYIQLMPPEVASAAETLFRIAIALFVVSALPVVVNVPRVVEQSARRRRGEGLE